MKTKLLLFVSLFICSWVQMNAQTATAPAIGDGTNANPYQIASLENLYWMATQVAGGTITFDNQSFIQTADIDATPTSTWSNAFGKMGTGTGFLPIGYKNNGTGTPTAFKGNYNGQNYKIDGLFINSLYNCTGLFGNIIGQDTIQNVRLTNVSISSTAQNVGGLVGQQNVGGATTILNCSVTGAISTTTTATAQMGGLIGISNSPITISNCYANCTITEGATDNATYVGGLMGWLKGGTITNCYAAGSIKAKSNVGGLIGNISVASTITNCYSSVAVTATTTPKGGLIGGATATTVNNCFWDTDTSTQATSAGTELGKTTAEMTAQSTFTGWDFAGIWGIASGFKGGYPFLTYFTPMATTATAFTSSGFTANWAAVTAATGYKLDVATDNAFTNIVSGYNNLSVAGTSQVVTGLSALTPYYYRVRAINVATGDNSNVITATTSGTTAISSPVSSPFKVMTSNGTLLVENVPAFMVYNVQGVKVAEVCKNTTASNVYLGQGIYIVKSGNQVVKVSVK